MPSSSSTSRNDDLIQPRLKSPSIPSNRAFPFKSLPAELALRTLLLAASHSQSTYRALTLTSHYVRNLIRLEALPYVPITLSRRRQISAFLVFLSSEPQRLVAKSIRHLWIVPDSPVLSRHSDEHLDDNQHPDLPVCQQIIRECTGLVSLACRLRVLRAAICRADVLRHTECVDLTLMDFNRDNLSLGDLVKTQVGAQFLNQLDRLHIFGPLDGYVLYNHPWNPPPVVVTVAMRNLTHLSVSLGFGSSLSFLSPFLKTLLTENLEQIWFTSRLHGEEAIELAEQLRYIDPRCELAYRPRRCKEMNIWMNGRERLWEQRQKSENEMVEPSKSEGAYANRRRTKGKAAFKAKARRAARDERRDNRQKTLDRSASRGASRGRSRGRIIRGRM